MLHENRGGTSSLSERKRKIHDFCGKIFKHVFFAEQSSCWEKYPIIYLFKDRLSVIRVSIIGFASNENKSQGVQTFESTSIIYSGTESWLQVQVFTWRRSFSYCVWEMCFVVLIMSCISNYTCQICNVGNISPVTLCWTMFILSNHG